MDGLTGKGPSITGETRSRGRGCTVV